MGKPMITGRPSRRACRRPRLADGRRQRPLRARRRTSSGDIKPRMRHLRMRRLVACLAGATLAAAGAAAAGTGTGTAGAATVADVASLSAAALQSADDAACTFWEGTNPSFAFLDVGSLTDKRTAGMVRTWTYKFLGRYDWTDRSVIDYGAASGLLGEWLLLDGNARHYVAVDISERAVDAARQRLTRALKKDGGGYRGKFEAVQAPVELYTLSGTREAHAQPPPADTLVSTKTLQHFASLEMLAGFLRNVRHSGIETVMLQLVEADEGESSCYGSVQEYAQQSGTDAIIARLGHWCRVTVEWVQRELAGGPGASLLGGGSGDGLASYVLEWQDREGFTIPAQNLKPRGIGEPPPQGDFTNIYLGFRRVRPKANRGIGRLRTAGGKCVVCMPKLLESSVDGGSSRAASCAVRAAQDGLRVMGKHSALIGGIVSPDQRPGGAAEMIELLQRTASPFRQKKIVLITLPGTDVYLVQAFAAAAAAATKATPDCPVVMMQPEPPGYVSHGGWAYNVLLQEAAVTTAEYVVLADLSLFDFKLHAGTSAGLGHGPGRGWQVDGVATTFAHVGWDVMCANGVVGTEGAYYDTRSLSTTQLPDTTSLHAKGVHLSPHITPFHAMVSDADPPPVGVEACFGGLMVVRRSAVGAGKCHYDPEALNWAEAHFGFHSCMRGVRAREEEAAGDSAHGGTFVNPAMMVHYDSESARERCAVVDCDPSYDEWDAKLSAEAAEPCVFELEESAAVDAARSMLVSSGGGGGSIKDSTITAWSGSHAHKPNWLVSEVEEEANRALKNAIREGDVSLAETAARACEIIGVSLEADYAGAPGTPLGVAVALREQTMLRWLLGKGVSVGSSASKRSVAGGTPAPVVLAAQMGEGGMVLQMLADDSTGGRQWLRENSRGRVAAIMGVISAQQATESETSVKVMQTIEQHHREEQDETGYKKHVYYKGADWAGDTEAGDAAEEQKEKGRRKGTACESSPCLNGGICVDLLEDADEDLYDLDGADLNSVDAAAYECRCERGWVGFDCDGMSSQREGCDFLFPLFGVFVLPFGCQIRGSISAVGSGIDRLEALRSLIGGTYKDGSLDRMWGRSGTGGEAGTKQTPLMVAAQEGWVGGVESLLSLGADGGVKDEHGHGSVYAALAVLRSVKVVQGQQEKVTAAAAIVSLLIQAGVTPSEKDWSGVHGRAVRSQLVDQLQPRLRARLASMLRKTSDFGDQRIGRGKPVKKPGNDRIKRKHGFHSQRSVERSKYSDL